MWVTTFESLDAAKQRKEMTELPHLSGAVGRSTIPMGTQPALRESLYQKDVKKKSRNKIKDVGNEGQSFFFFEGQHRAKHPLDITQLFTVKETDDRLMSIILQFSLPSPETAPVATKSDASVSCHLP